MLINDLSEETLERIGKMRYDWIVEKHEGPEIWNLRQNNSELEEIIKRYQAMGLEYDPPAEFLKIGDNFALLPISQKNHANITILHYFLSQDEQKLVVYLKDTTYDATAFGAGFVAICDKFPNQKFFTATLYHEWFILDYDPLADLWKEKSEET
jgi:hypothetical protein